jgi:hypothetical protein
MGGGEMSTVTTETIQSFTEKETLATSATSTSVSMAPAGMSLNIYTWIVMIFIGLSQEWLAF